MESLVVFLQLGGLVVAFAAATEMFLLFARALIRLVYRSGLNESRAYLPFVCLTGLLGYLLLNSGACRANLILMGVGAVVLAFSLVAFLARK